MHGTPQFHFVALADGHAEKVALHWVRQRVQRGQKLLVLVLGVRSNETAGGKGKLRIMDQPL